MAKNEIYLKARGKQVQVYSICIYDERVNEISFNSDGICNYCEQVERLKKEYGTGTKEGQKN